MRRPKNKKKDRLIIIEKWNRIQFENETFSKSPHLSSSRVFKTLSFNTYQLPFYCIFFQLNLVFIYRNFLLPFFLLKKNSISLLSYVGKLNFTLVYSTYLLDYFSVYLKILISDLTLIILYQRWITTIMLISVFEVCRAIYAYLDKLHVLSTRFCDNPPLFFFFFDFKPL